MNTQQQLIIGNTIKSLTYMAIGITCIGFIIYTTQNYHQEADYSVFNKHAAFNWQYFLYGLTTFNGYYITLLGILLLMCTPILRILFVTIAFALEKNRLYTLIGILILCILTISAVLGTS